jgi:hypothetical protein
MIIRSGKPPPSWFKLSDYTTPPLGSAGWAAMLSARDKWHSAFHGTGRDDLAPEAQKEIALNSNERRTVFWDRYLEEVSPVRFVGRQAGEDLPSGAGVPRAPNPIEDVTEAAVVAAGNPLVPFEWDVGFIGQRVILVDLAAADKKLKEEFAAWLARERKWRPSSFKRRGRPSTNSSVTDAHLKSWRDYRVLAVFDLDFYAAVFEEPPLSHEDLCKELNPGFRGNPKEWGISAREKVKEAFASINDLIAQK